jgi:hypothetical protein
MKKIAVLLITLVIVVVGFTLMKNIIAETAMIKGVKAMAGLDVRIRGVNVGILKPVLSLDGLKILNPDAFTDKIMADFPEIYIHYDLGGFFKGKAHFENMRINLKELTVARNQQNQVNIKSLTAFMPKGGGGKPPEIQIDHLNLIIGKVFYKDYSSGKPTVREFNVNINEKFDNVNDPKALMNLILVKALSKTSIPSLANVDLGGLSKAMTGQAQSALGGITEKASEALTKAKEGIAGMFKGAK